MKVFRDGDGVLQKVVMDVPVDPHTHLREGEMLFGTVLRSAGYFDRVLAMPNLTPPLTTVQLCDEYLARIDFSQDDLMRRGQIKKKMSAYTALYLTDQTSAEEIEMAAAHNRIIAGKLYPAGATTGSASGVSDLALLEHVFDAMERKGLVLSVHGEVVGNGLDIFERERIFVDSVLPTIVKRHPGLRIILEHISTEEAVDFVKAHENVFATVTPQHITYSYNDMLANGMRPGLFCFPVLQTEHDRQAVLEFATSGRPDVFLGTDSAPHPVEKKHSGCAPGGFYDPHPLDLYIKAFESVGAIEKLEDFSSRFAAEFYGWELSDQDIALERNDVGVFVS